MAKSQAAPRHADAVHPEPKGRGNGRSAAPRVPEVRERPVISGVRPQVDGGRRPAKAAVGDVVVVEADAFADGHDVVVSTLRHQRDGVTEWSSVPMASLGNDRWRGQFDVPAMGGYRFVVDARVDRFLTWRRDLRARIDADQNVALELLVGAGLLEAG